MAVAGASGKTTTTSMLAVALPRPGSTRPSSVGGDIPQIGGSATVGRRRRLRRRGGRERRLVPRLPARRSPSSPTSSPTTSTSTARVEDVESALSRSRADPADGGLLVACADDPGSLRLAGREPRPRAGASSPTAVDERADLVVAIDGRPSGLGSRSTPVRDGVRHELVLRVPGRHNVLNAAAAYLAAVAGLGRTAAAVARRAGGVHRGPAPVRGRGRGRRRHGRRRLRAQPGQGRVRGAARPAGSLGRAGDGRLHVVFQPHLYSRTRDFAAEFAAALALADEVVLLDIYARTRGPRRRASPATLVAAAVPLPARARRGRRAASAGRGRRAGRRARPTRRPRPDRRRRRRHDAGSADPARPWGSDERAARRPGTGAHGAPAPWPRSGLGALPLRGAGHPGPAPSVAAGAVGAGAPRRSRAGWSGSCGGARSCRCAPSRSPG